MKKTYLITVLTTLIVIAAAFLVHTYLLPEEETVTIKVGCVYIGDASTAYTENFLRAMDAAERSYSDQIEVVPKYNIPEGSEDSAFQELVDEGCELIFSTSYGYGETAKKYAELYPSVQFCQATCDNANSEPVLENYHTFMGEIYQGRYICGVVAGLKLAELIDEGRITVENAKVGYVGAFPYAEVISGYTAFFLGVRSVVPNATMEVLYTNTWSSYALELEAAERLIDDGCVIISQHSDTKGAAVACENTDPSVAVYHIGYNQSMSDVAPTTTLTGCRINWEPYMSAAIGAVLEGKDIEDCVEGSVHGNDVSAAFAEGWVEMLEINEITAAPGTAERVAELITQFEQGEIHVFRGNYVGVDPFDETDTWDLHTEYLENADASAPSFHYVLQNVITTADLRA